MIQKYFIGADGITRDVYGRVMEFDRTVLRQKNGKRKFPGPRTAAVKLARGGSSESGQRQ